MKEKLIQQVKWTHCLLGKIDIDCQHWAYTGQVIELQGQRKNSSEIQADRKVKLSTGEGVGVYQ